MMKPFFSSTAAKAGQMILLLLMVVLLAGSGLLARTDAALGAPAPAGSQAGPTPAPQTAPQGNTRGASPIVGVLVLLAPILFLAWKSRGKKQPEISASCCLPVIDESKRPFQIIDEEQSGSSTGTQEAPKA